MTSHLSCNFPQCSSEVQDVAWITSCSHVLCAEHGSASFAMQRTNKCPVCQADLASRMDVVKTDTNPSEQYKSMILAGQKPETVIEIASRALSFWNYQIQLQSSRDKQERLAQERKIQEALAKANQEKTTLEMDLKNAANQIEDLKKRASDLDNALAEKTRQNLKLTSTLDAMRCRLAELESRQVQRTGSAGGANFPQRLGAIATSSMPLNPQTFSLPGENGPISRHFQHSNSDREGAGQRGYVELGMENPQFQPTNTQRPPEGSLPAFRLPF